MNTGGLREKKQAKRNYKMKFGLFKSFKPPIICERNTTSLKVAMREAEMWALEQQSIGCKAICEIEYETEIGTKVYKIDYETALAQRKARKEFKKDKKPIAFIMTE
jgi:hypothetical protein